MPKPKSAKAKSKASHLDAGPSLGAWSEEQMRADERQAWAEGHLWVAGVDEAGRGPLAGPVVAACVVLPESTHPSLVGLTDSKALAPEARARYVGAIQLQALAWGIGEATAEEIDAINILQATFLAMRRALAACDAQAQARGLWPAGEGPGLVLVDGNRPIAQWAGPQRCLVKGDGRSLAIAAASVLAKEHRDALLRGMDQAWPSYGFAQHKGYGTAAHWRALEAEGPCPEHRRSFLKRLLGPPGLA